MNPMPMIRTRGLTKIYRKGPVQIKALVDVSLDIREGEFVAVMGPSGAGKSTLLHILGCLDRPTRGDYFLSGTNVRQKNDRDLSLLRGRGIGFVFQSFNLLPHYTVFENVTLPYLYRGGTGPGDGAVRQKALAVLGQMGILGRAGHYPSELSGGEQQRAAIARALVQEPRVLLADEPTGNLDSATGGEITRIFEELNRDGATILMVTHNTRLARGAGRRIYIEDGAVRKED